ncbi:Proliferation marker protein Ki-67 [Frankliniella fusca]|uniref:Proliferation marker protein Ki-67 n=1 Tax=Frankliniella fusca TaxID=407009 RepID=A0AAE1LAV8_9NEOP|nr:Proliferation marker protein Ki-67 [Frankliniella fusca]
MPNIIILLVKMVHGHIIILKKNGDDGARIPVDRSVKIGRGTHCDVRIIVQSVSEQHCLVLIEDGRRALLQNLSSTSQTLVNGVSIGKERHALQHGDIVGVGERSFRWQYAEPNPFYEGKQTYQKRRKSEADSARGSQNVAVVNPLYQKRRTLGPNIIYSESSVRSPKVPVLKEKNADKSVTRNSLASAKTPLKRASSISKTPQGTRTPKTPKVETPKARTPKSETPKLKTQRAETPKAKALKAESPKMKTSKTETPMAKTPMAQTSKDKTPKGETLKAKTPKADTPEAKTPKAETPKGKIPHAESPKARTPKADSPRAKTPKAATLKTKTPKGETPKSKTPKAETPKAKTPKAAAHKAKTPKAETPKAKTPKAGTPKAETPKVKTPRAATPKTKFPSSQTAVSKPESKRKSVKSTRGVKRRLSSPSKVASKRLKIESPKSIDKKKMTALMGIHGKSPRTVLPSTPTVRLVLSSKKTPIVKTSKTPRPSTVKKTGVVKSSVKKTHKPTFAEILKKKAVQRANAVVKKLTLAPKPQPKVSAKKAESIPLSTEIPKAFKFGSTGHANSPETIIIGRKVAKTPVATRKGRKGQLIQQTLKGSLNLSGISEMFQTPVKDVSKKSTGPSPSFAPNESSSSPLPRTHKSPRNSRHALNTPDKVNMPRGGQPLASEAMVSEAKTTEKYATPRKTPLKTPVVNAMNTSGRSSTRSARQFSLLTSTPAVIGRSQSFAESVFNSPSSLLTGQMSAPQSPASGRKSRLDMVASRSPHVHSPHSSPVKSSLKTSPSKSPPSGHSKNLSVSFNDNIRIKMLVSGSKKGLDTTAPLSCPGSPQGSEGNSGTVTPDLTTFDFNSIKTPNVPREMFVSSILSSGGSSSSQAAGSAKRKGKAQKSPTNDLSDLRGIRRLMKTPSSPAGYVDVKGVKRLMATCPTPTYLAVEGVKKLFNDAAAAAGNDLGSFAGVRELFASPTPSKMRKVSLKNSPTGPQETTPVAKIQAEVESKGRSSTGSPPKTSNASLSPLHVSPKLLESTGVKSVDEQKPVLRGRGRTTRNKVKDALSKADSPKQASFTEDVRETRRSAKSETSEVVKPTRKTRTNVVPPQVNELKSPVAESPPKRRTRRAAKVSPPPKMSPDQKMPKVRTRKGAKTASPVSRKISRNSSNSIEEANLTSTVADVNSSVTAPKVVAAKSQSKKANEKQVVAMSPVKSPPKRRATRRGGRAIDSSPAAKPAKRALSPTEVSESPVKKQKGEAKSLSPKKSPPKRTTRRGKKDATPATEELEVPSATSSKRKRKAVSFDDEAVTPSKREKRESHQKVESPSIHSSPDKGKPKKAQSKNQAQAKSAKTKKELSVTVSPRRTRSRK